MIRPPQKPTLFPYTPLSRSSAKKPVGIVEKFMTMEYGPAPEDPREALAWLDVHNRRFGHFINGEWHAPAAGTCHSPLMKCPRSEEHTSELQSRLHLVCRLLL